MLVVVDGRGRRCHARTRRSGRVAESGAQQRSTPTGLGRRCGSRRRSLRGSSAVAGHGRRARGDPPSTRPTRVGPRTRQLGVASGQPRNVRGIGRHRTGADRGPGGLRVVATAGRAVDGVGERACGREFGAVVLSRGLRRGDRHRDVGRRDEPVGDDPRSASRRSGAFPNRTVRWRHDRPLSESRRRSGVHRDRCGRRAGRSVTADAFPVVHSRRRVRRGPSGDHLARRRRLSRGLRRERRDHGQRHHSHQGESGALQQEAQMEGDVARRPPVGHGWPARRAGRRVRSASGGHGQVVLARDPDVRHAGDVRWGASAGVPCPTGEEQGVLRSVHVRRVGRRRLARQDRFVGGLVGVQGREGLQTEPREPRPPAGRLRGALRAVLADLCRRR
ncbi:unannotated protein [freshwater metagenome]|uniref:Unannotated protein n=1 Tax=freshwater metagenome TaxID=449393 RepID=A0A6J6EX57_9ZZZZ